MAFIVYVSEDIPMDFNENYKSMLYDISIKIKTLRKNKGLTQEDMQLYGFNYRHYQRIECGTHSPSLYTLFKLAKVFQVELKSLL